MSILFAATFPERTQSLTLYGSFASFVRTDDHPWMPTRERRAYNRERVDALWGQGRIIGNMFPSDELTPEMIERLAAVELRCASPGAVVQLLEMDENIDVRAIVPTIAVPTLVVHNTGDETVPYPSGVYLAENIPGARLVSQDVAGHISTDPASMDWLADFEEFTTGARPAEFIDRVLSTVLFSDIVGSSEKAVSLGDQAWRRLLERHHDLVRRQLARHRGKEVDTAGDGFFASFDGPARAIRCGCAIAETVRELGLDVRVGVHTGECELVDGKVAGIAVHTGARVAANAHPGEVLVSSTVKDLVAGSGLSFEDRGTHELKGIPGEWRLYAVSRRAESLPQPS